MIHLLANAPDDVSFELKFQQRRAKRSVY